jgi:hypothetical protein
VTESPNLPGRRVEVKRTEAKKAIRSREARLLNSVIALRW